MKIDAVGVCSSNFAKTIEFYGLLGFVFPELSDMEDHLEATSPNIPRLMIDHIDSTTEMLGEKPRPGNTSIFAVLCDSPGQVNEVVANIKARGFEVKKDPWDAPWGQRYAVVMDPDGYLIDLFAGL